MVSGVIFNIGVVMKLIGGTYSICTNCGHQGYAYGKPSSKGVSIAYCHNCGLNSYLEPVGIRYETQTKDGHKKTILDNRHIYKNKRRGPTNRNKINEAEIGFKV